MKRPFKKVTPSFLRKVLIKIYNSEPYRCEHKIEYGLIVARRWFI